MGEMHYLLKSALDLAPLVASVYPEPVMVGVTDTEKYLYYLPAPELNIRIKPGDPIPKGSIADTVLQAGQPVTRRVSSEIFGVPYIATSAPLIDAQGQIVGAVMTGTNIDKQEKTQNMADNLSASAQELTASSQNLAASAQHLASVAQNLAEKSSYISTDIKQTDRIMYMIKEVAARTHILGLNATIEAARVGDAGRGFNVVAEEIRKLSGSTSKSTGEIFTLLKNTQHSISQLIAQIDEISAVSQEQAAATQQIFSSISMISSLAESLSSLAKTLI